MNTLSTRERSFVIVSALLALFLGALDALIMSAAMPTIVSELGGLHLYAWVYSVYFLSRAVALPIFGKLADLYPSKNLFLFSISLFVISSIAAGLAQSMSFLIFCRVFQGIGAGGNFALVYIVLSEVAPPGQRAKTLSFASSIWGISSVIGPTLGGFIVSYFSWRWIFFINIPMGLASLAGISLFLKETRAKTKGVAIDIKGLTLFSSFILGLLIIFITGGRDLPWISAKMALISLLTALLGFWFFLEEKRCRQPFINIDYFRNASFALGNGATFFSSFTIFAFFAYAPVYIQGGLGLSPMQVGIAMVSLSLGWSFGSLFLGRFTDHGGGKKGAVAGGLTLLSGSLLTLQFLTDTTMTECFLVFLVIGIGMGFVSLSTLLIVQNSVEKKDLGVATSLHQFGRSLGGTIGVGISGGLATSGLLSNLEKAIDLFPAELVQRLGKSIEILLQPQFSTFIPAEAQIPLRQAVLDGVFSIFWVTVLSSLLCLCCCLFLPAGLPDVQDSAE
ncbi:MAG: MFS transporter [Desulfocapsaceae bacterium]|jgi:EmrB/QacA subfamily drug resistance transporter|nr:MFS transporter [Desulfocapsaceae bacterium]